MGKQLIIWRRAPEYIIEWVCASRRGVWIFRGPEIPAIMLDECYDMELYDFVKADLSDPVRCHGLYACSRYQE